MAFQGEGGSVQVAGKTDYALRAASELALAATEDAGPIKGDWISETQGIPKKFMENILHDLKRSGLVRTRRGASGGYWLALPAEEISLAVRANLRAVLESVTLADIVDGKLPSSITKLTRDPEAWVHH